MQKLHEGKGYISKLVHFMEQYAVDNGYTELTIGVEARETRNLAIYLHWGYDKFVMSEIEEGALVLYYSKKLKYLSGSRVWITKQF
jgi:GNAT superfamily N-acetyltransferase